MPKARPRKDTPFQNNVTRSVFLYGNPNKEKLSRLREMEVSFADLVCRDIRILDRTPEVFLQLVKNDKKDPEMRKLEKSIRVQGYNSAFCQNAFDMAVTHLSNRLEAIRLGLIPQFGILALSKVLFAMAVSGASRADMISSMKALGKKFHMDCARELEAVDDGAFSFLMAEFRDQYAMSCMEYRLPQPEQVSVPLDSRLMKLEPSDNTVMPYVLTVSDPLRKRDRIAVPVDTSRHSLHKIRSNRMAGTVMFRTAGEKVRIGWSYDRHMDTPEENDTIGVDTGITDALYLSDGTSIGSMKGILDYYHGEVEPAFAVMSDIRNKKRSIKHYLHSHDLPEDVGRSLIHKMDRLEQMLQTMEAPFRKKHRYYGMLDHEVSSDVKEYLAHTPEDALTVLEKLDIREFHKSRKLNGRMSMFARGKLQEKLMAELNRKGRPFMEVLPDYTSQTCPVCANLDPANRNGKTFRCTCCGHEDDADHNASVNIRARADDRGILKTCEAHRYSHKAVQEALKELYADRNKEYLLHTASM